MELKRILIVEDNNDIRMLIRMTLEFGRFELHEAVSGEEGLRLVHALQPHLIVLDVMMAGPLDGYQLCQAVRRDPQLSRIGVILVTARGQATDIAAGHSAGADAYLIKPFSPIELITQVESCLMKRAA
jgi:DNA-binding response OmpR family regulator